MKTPYIICGACGALAMIAVLAVMLKPGQQPIKPQRAAQVVLPRYEEPDVQAYHQPETDYTVHSWIAILGILGIIYLTCLILMLAWVARDSRARGVDGGAVWVLLVLLTGVIGLLVYMASRPHGILVPCESCGNRKLMHAKVCPHCGNSVLNSAVYVDLNQ